MSVTVAAFVVSIFALLLSGTAILYARRTADAADRQAAEAGRQADAAHEELHLANIPVLTVTLKDESASGPDVQYEIRNDGRKDLDSVVVQRPEAIGRVRYPIARVGVTDFEDQVELGPLRLGETSQFLLKVGSTPSPPEFRVRIACCAGGDKWDVSKLLAPPAGSVPSLLRRTSTPPGASPAAASVHSAEGDARFEGRGVDSMTTPHPPILIRV